VDLIGAIDIGGSKIEVGVVSPAGKILARHSSPTQPECGFVHTLAHIETTLRQLSQQTAPFMGIGVGCPGPLDAAAGIIGDVGTLPTWQGGALATELESRFHVKVAIENDADAAALAESRWGNARTATRFIYIAVSTGIGGGIVLDGKLYRGVGGAHPELGHQIIDASGPLCYCGAHGCWESLASGTAMGAWVRSVDPNTAWASAADICRRAAKGEPLAQRAVRRLGYYLGRGLANLVTLFAPDRIALGGGVMNSAHLFLDPARQVVRQLCTQVPAELTVIERAYLGPDVGLLGAAQCWLERHGRPETIL
jgi:glucokinase